MSWGESESLFPYAEGAAPIGTASNYGVYAFQDLNATTNYAFGFVGDNVGISTWMEPGAIKLQIQNTFGHTIDQVRQLKSNST